MVLDSNLLYGRRMTLITFSDGKVVMRDGKVGTEQACCCGSCNCSNLNFNDLLYGDELYSWPNVDLGGQKTPMYGSDEEPPHESVPGSGFGECQIKKACLRWVCIKFSATGDVVDSAVYGGPTTNDRDLVELVLETEGSEQGGCWLYTFEFFAWNCYAGGYPRCPIPPGEDVNGDCPVPRVASEWTRTLIPGDTMFSIYKTQLGG